MTKNFMKYIFSVKKQENTDPKFSVIMPAYNRAFCIENSIDSLLRQTYTDYELIIIDDGSTDNTELLLKEKYKIYFQSRKFIYEKIQSNSGVCNARNVGLRLARNPWIAYLDTDNTMKNEFLSVFADNIRKKSKKSCFYAKRDKSTGHKFNYKQLCKCNYIDLGVFVHNRSLVVKYGDFDTNLKRLVDWDLILRYTKKEIPFFIDEVLIEYSNNDDFPRITNTEDLSSAYEYVLNKIKKILL